MANEIEIAKKLIVEARKVGRQEMSIRRTNSGIAGSIAVKVTWRRKWNDEYEPLSFEAQAACLAETLTKEELDYAKIAWA